MKKARDIYRMTSLPNRCSADEDKRNVAVARIRALAKQTDGMTVEEILRARDEGRR